MLTNSKKKFAALWVFFTLSLIIWACRFWSNLPAFMDTLEYVFPEKWFNVGSFQKGLIPLWNPYIACGTPHVANFQSAAFYPFFWIWNFTGLTHWFFIVALAHNLIAAAGFYFWLRSLKVTPNIAALCALSWGGSTYLVLLWGFPTHLASLAWVPWIFWATQRLLEKNLPGRWLALSGFWSLQILAGYPIFTFYALIFWSVYWLSRPKQTWARVSVFLSAFGLSLACTAIQWLSFLDLFGYMHREMWGSTLYQLKWKELLTLFSPNILGIPGSVSYQGDYGNFIFSNYYLGLVPLFVLFGCLWTRKQRIDFWLKSLVLCAFFPLGIHFFLWNIFPEKILDHLEISKSSFLFPFCALTVVGLSLEEMTKKKSAAAWFKKFGWIMTAVWMLDIAAIPLRVIHLVPDPYQNVEVEKFAQRVKSLAGEGRILSLRTDDAVYSSSVTDYAGSFRETAERMTQNTNVVWGIRSAQAHLTTVVDGYQNLSNYIRQGYPYNSRVLDAAGVRLLIADKTLPGFKYSVHEKQAGWELIRNAGVMSTEWLVDQGATAENRAQAFGDLLDPKAFLENKCWLDKDAQGRTASLEPVSTMARYSADSPCGFQFSVPAGHSSYFLLDQSFAPGWHGWVDGQPRPILRANGLWMALELEPGQPHQVTFQYSPTSFRLGLFLSLITLAGCLWLGIRVNLIRPTLKRSI